MAKNNLGVSTRESPRVGAFLASASAEWSSLRMPTLLESTEARGEANGSFSPNADVPGDLMRWIEFLCDYATDWDRAFNARSGYFTQEYWSLFVGCVMCYWSGSPVTMSEACQLMLTGSNRTREERIKRAVMDGFLSKERTEEHGRNAFVIPTPRLERLMHAHLMRTLSLARSALLR